MIVHTFDNTPGRSVLVNGKSYLFFSGFGYLGMNHLPEFKDLIKEGIDRYGILFPSSRISNTHLSLFDEFETLLSGITGTEKTAAFSSGFMAGQAAVHSLKGKIINLPEAHPAIYRVDSRAIKNDNGEDVLLSLINDPVEHNAVIVTDGVNPITGAINNFDFIAKIKQPVTLLIDDSHGIGLVGNDYTGIRNFLPKNPMIEYVFTYSLSKAYGINAGAVSGKADAIALTKTTPYFTAATCVPPAFMHAFLFGQQLYKKQQKKLKENINLLHHLTHQNFSAGLPHTPVFILPEQFDAAYFYRKNIIISSFAYPNINGPTINRIVLNALHTAEDIQLIADLLNRQQ